MVTCEVWNCWARSATRTLPSCCIISRIARRRSSLSILFPTPVSMVFRQSVFDFFLYSMILFCSMANSLVGLAKSRSGARDAGENLDNHHKTEVKVSTRNNFQRSSVLTEAGCPLSAG